MTSFVVLSIGANDVDIYTERNNAEIMLYCASECGSMR